MVGNVLFSSILFGPLFFGRTKKCRQQQELILALSLSSNRQQQHTMSAVTNSSCNCITVDSSSDVPDIIEVSDSDSAPTVDSTRSADSLKRPRSNDEDVVSKPKRSTFKTPLFDSESSDVDTAAATQAPTATLTQSVLTVSVTEPKVDSPRKKYRKNWHDVNNFNKLSKRADDHDIDLNTPPFTSMGKLYNSLKLLSDSDDEGDDIHSDHDDDINDDVDSEPNSDDEQFINDGNISHVDTHDDSDITDEEGINTSNIITGKRECKAPERYFFQIKNLKKLLFADVPSEERRHAFGSSDIHSD